MAANSPPDHGAGSSITDGEEEQGPPKKIPKIQEEEAKEGDNRRAIRGATSAPRRQAPRRTPIKTEATGTVKAEETGAIKTEEAGSGGGAQGQSSNPNPQRRRPYSAVQIARASNAPPFTVFQCEICDKTCKTAAALGSHRRVHDRDGN